MIKYLKPLSLLLIIVGGINWLLIGFFEFNLVNYIFASIPIVERAIYALVGISGLYCIPLFRQVCSESFNNN